MTRTVTTRSFLVALLSFALIILLIPTLVSALLPQLSLALFSKEVVPYGQLRTVGVPLLLLALLVVQGRVYPRTSVYVPSLVFVAYGFVVSALHLARHDLDYLIPGYLNFYFFASALLAASLLRPFFSYWPMFRLLIWVAVACSALGITQYLTSDPLVAVKDPTGNFEVLSWMFYETQPYRVRGFSLFNNALEFGVFLTFVSGIVLYAALRVKRWYWAVLPVLLFAVFATLTRNVYLGAGVSLLAVIAYRYLRAPRLLLALPVMALLLGYLISGSVNLGGEGLSNTRTLDIRNIYWQIELMRQERNDLASLLLGSGIYQTGGEHSNTLLFVDNSYLQIVAQLGLFGLLLFIWVYWAILREVVARPKNALRAGLYGFLVSWPMMGIFNIIIAPVLLYSFLILTSREDSM